MRWAPLLVLGVTMLSCGPDNTGTCVEYVESYNSVVTQCNPGTPPAELQLLQESTACPAHLDSGGVDCTLYYECLRDAYACVGGVIVGNADDCTGCI